MKLNILSNQPSRRDRRTDRDLHFGHIPEWSNRRKDRFGPTFASVICGGIGNAGCFGGYSRKTALSFAT